MLLCTIEDNHSLKVITDQLQKGVPPIVHKKQENKQKEKSELTAVNPLFSSCGDQPILSISVVLVTVMTACAASPLRS